MSLEDFVPTKVWNKAKQEWTDLPEGTTWNEILGEENKQKDLVDDLAWVLASTVVGWHNETGIDLSEHPEVKRVMARYLDAKEGDATLGNA